MSVWVWIVFLALATGVAVFAVRISRHAREDPFADVPRDEGSSMLDPRERSAGETAGTSPPADDEPLRRASLEERLRAAAEARAARAADSDPRTATSATKALDRGASVSATPTREAAMPDIVPLDPARRSAHELRWRTISEAMTRSPAAALPEADALMRELMAERGFPTDADDEAMTEAAVAHPDVIDPFRLATAIAARAAAGRATDDELRRATVHVRDVIVRLFADDPARTT